MRLIVWERAALHERATGALNQALKQYLKDRVEPDAEQRALFRYPPPRDPH